MTVAVIESCCRSASTVDITSAVRASLEGERSAVKEETEQALGVTLIEYTQENPAGIGWVYDESTGKFNPPESTSP